MTNSRKIFLGFAIIFLFSSLTQAQAKKYDIKSGIVTLENTIRMGGKDIATRKQVVYFDEFGMKECKDDYEGDKLVKSFFSDGKDLYTAVYAEKTAYKAGKAFRGTELKVNWNEVSEPDKKSGKAKKLPNMKIAGKDCEAYAVTDRGTTTTFAGWKGVCFLMDQASGEMTTVTKTVKIEENAKVPAEKFQVPAGFTLK